MVAIHALTLFGLLPALALSAHIPHDSRHVKVSVAPRNGAIADGANAGHRSVSRAIKKRSCKAKTASASAATSAASDDTWSASATEAAASVTETASWSQTTSTDDASTTEATVSDDANEASITNESSADSWSSSSSDEATATWSSESSSATLAVSNAYSSSGSSGSLLSVTDATCGWCESSDSAPNGSEDWLNCGITGSGWTPPMVTIDQLVSVALTSSGPFAACADYFDKFDTYGSQYGLPPILLASIALQESSCDPSVTGGNGEAGLMQLASGNCADAPDGNCYDVDYNIEGGAKYFAQVLSDNSGNALAALGSYNGWFVGMTVADATAAKAAGDCHAQNNLDYLTQTFNGWMQGIEGYNLGSYRNLDGC